MIIKHLKIFYLFFLKRKFFTIVTLISTITILSLDYIAISIVVYRIFNLLNRENTHSVFSTLFIIVILRFLFQIFIFWTKDYSRRNNSIISFKKFFSSIENSNPDTEYGNEQMLKIQSEINSTTLKIENYYSKIIIYFAGIISALFFIMTSFVPISFMKFATVLISFTIHLLVVLLCTFKSSYTKKNSYLIDKKLFMTNKLLIQLNNNKDFDTMEWKNTINVCINDLEKLLLIASVKNFVFEGVNYCIKSSQFLLLYTMLQTNVSGLRFIEASSICFIFYNLAYTFFAIKITELFYNIDIDNLIDSVNFTINTIDTKISNFTAIDLLEFRNITVTAKGHILRDINFKITKKQNVCFISNQNSISLISMIFQNKATRICGDIMINQVDIDRYNNNLIKENIVTISSDPFIKCGTIKDNININNIQFSDELIIQACKLSGFHNYIISTILGYFTDMDSCTQLKKIEKLQLSFSRALLSNAQIIVVDFLDINEDDIQIHKLKDMLMSSSTDRIVIFITQNTYRLKEMDNIFIVENNHITATGLHNSLLQNSLFYSDFYLKNHDEVIFTE